MNRYIDVEVQEEENKALKDLILTLYAYIPHRCYNCTHFEQEKIGEEWCYRHDRKTKRNDGCPCFELQNGLYVKIKGFGIEV